jgi:hypothetical protein
MAHHVDGLSERLGCFLRRHTAEVAHLNQLRQRVVFQSERIECAI